ncbi:MAG: SHOCT domain-containing protein [Myxococcota bacterium]|nr:SHOCT domain-containing protein [Myxococcota bacterium]
MNSTIMIQPISVFATLLLLATLSPTSAHADRTASIRNIPPTPLHAPAGTPLADIAAAIRSAADSEQWIIVGESPGSMTARLHIRAHTATVTIQYTESTYQIDYLDSQNLDYKPDDLVLFGSYKSKRKSINGPRIHNNYNIWVEDLGDSIEAYSYNPPKAESPKGAARPNPILIADELEKLDALRQRGVLTQEEFDQQKAKLLQ